MPPALTLVTGRSDRRPENYENAAISMASRSSDSPEGPLRNIQRSGSDENYFRASSISRFCSSACRFAEPTAGLAFFIRPAYRITRSIPLK